VKNLGLANETQMFYHCATTSLVKKFDIIEFIMYDIDKKQHVDYDEEHVNSR
jgi:hypothetical protein